ncbi:MAG: DUF4231 domain-containing protein [Anaerolineales bacterium]
MTSEANHLLSPEEFISSRVADQIDWYDRKSQSTKKWFHGLRASEIALASSIPFLVGLISETIAAKYIVGVLAVLIAVLSGLIALLKLQENWIDYRTTAETLKHHKYLYLTRTDPYDDEDAYARFVANIEELISIEHTTWVGRMKAVRRDRQHG